VDRFWRTGTLQWPVATSGAQSLNRNPVKRGLATRPEDWEWSSYRHYAEHIGGTVEIASPWNEWRKRPNTPTLSPTEGEKGGAPTLA